MVPNGYGKPWKITITMYNRRVTPCDRTYPLLQFMFVRVVDFDSAYLLLWSVICGDAALITSLDSLNENTT